MGCREVIGQLSLPLVAGLPLLHLLAEPSMLVLALIGGRHVGLSDLRRVFIHVGGCHRARAPSFGSTRQAVDFALALWVMDTIGEFERIGCEVEEKSLLQRPSPKEFTGACASHDVAVSRFAEHDIPTGR